MQRETAVPELKCRLKEFVHEPTGAHILHLENDDPENLFCLSFQTVPKSSNGVAHILEHTVLCGSEKYPVKDPFFAMTRRSLNTFMNALTGSDFTCYPAASQVKQDFYNLLEVYLDAVFHPLLQEMSFKQEGIRLDSENGELQFKGVVFNEMKGALASGSSRMCEALNHALFPAITYGVNSGGDPLVIPSLNYPELKAFHQTFYHPSRCLFFFYGNFPIEEHLAFLEEKVLSKAKKLPSLPKIPEQPRFHAPKRLSLRYPLAKEESFEKRGLISFGWLTCPILDQQTILALSILELMLMDTDASPVKMALLRSGLCTQAFISLDSEITEVPLCIHLKGCEVENAQALEEVLFKALREVEIIPPMIDNAMHQLEFQRSEIAGDHAPFGLSLFMRAGLLKQHGGDPLDGLKVHSLFDILRHKIQKNPRYFNDLIHQYLLNNPHFVRIDMRPDARVNEEELAQEKELLNQLRATVNLEQVKEEGKALAAFQEAQEEQDLDILPAVTLKDVDPKARGFALERDQVGSLDVYHHGAFTNEIVYADLHLDLPHLSEEELPLARFFSHVLTQVGAAGRTYQQTLDYIQAHTGGMGASVLLHTQASDPSIFKPCFVLRGKALYRKADRLFPLMLEVLTETDLSDRERILEILRKHLTGLESSLQTSALSYAINLAAQGLNVPARIRSLWYGLDYVARVKEWVKDPTFIDHLAAVKEKILCVGQAELVIASDSIFYKKLVQERFYGLDTLISRTEEPFASTLSLPSVPSQGRLISSPVAFTTTLLPTLPYTHPDSAALSIASHLFDNLTLHPDVREQGGAYGSGASNDMMGGAFYFYSYRDPHLGPTLHAFTKAMKTLSSGDFDAQDLEEAKLEIIQSLDSPVAPGTRASVAYHWLKEGKEPAVRQMYRDRVLSTTLEDVRRAVATHLEASLMQATTISFANQDFFKRDPPPFSLYSV